MLHNRDRPAHGYVRRRRGRPDSPGSIDAVVDVIRHVVA